MSKSQLIVVNQFVTNARKAVGQISIKKLMADQDYQISVLLQALFVNDAALTPLVLQCCDALELDKRWLLMSQQFEAAYPVNSTNRQLARDCVLFLVQSVMHAPPKSTLYRLAVNSLLEMPFVSDAAFCAQLCRDYFAIVVKPLNAEAKGMPTAEAKPTMTLMEVWDRIDAEELNPLEGMAINAYQHLLKKEAIKQAQIELRIKLAKVLLVAQRGRLQKTSKTYREVAEEIKNSIVSPPLVEQFLTVTRQFYPYWQIT
jgi:hypothetical protein